MGIIMSAMKPVLFGQVLSPGENFWDIGANIGYFTLLAAAALENTGRIVAFEPGKTAFKRLQENIGLNHFRNINAVNLAASNSAGKPELYLASEIADTGANLYQKRKGADAIRNHPDHSS